MWNNSKKTAITVKQTVAPLQANEVANIRKKSASFDVRQHKFRELFRKIPPFFYNCEDPYGQIDSVSTYAMLYDCGQQQGFVRLNWLWI